MPKYTDGLLAIAITIKKGILFDYMTTLHPNLQVLDYSHYITDFLRYKAIICKETAITV